MTIYKSKHWAFMVSVLFLVLLAYFVLSISESYADTSSTTVKVTVTTLNVRSGASTGHSIVGKLTKGQTVNVSATVTTRTVKWYKITYKSKTAYICATYTKPVSKTTTYSPIRVGKATQSTMIRTGPSTAKPRIGTFKVGTQTNLYSLYTTYSTTTYKNWYRVLYNGKTGYIIKNFVAMQPRVVAYTKPEMGLTTSATVYRSSPSVTASTLGTLDKNSLITATAVVTTYTTSSMHKWYKTTFDGKTAYVYAGYVRIVSSDDAIAFEAYLTAQGFPESYKTYLRGLHADNPKWIFKAQKTGLEWSNSLAKEQQLGRSLVAASDYESWKSFEEGAYDFTNNKYIGFDSTWPAADDRIVAYYFDPRNFLNRTAIYQFLDHKFDADSQNKTTIRCIAAGSFMDTDSYASLIYDSGKASGVNPNVITSIIRQEQGTAGTNGSISGTYSGYVGYYNYFNVGSYTTDTMSAIQHGLWWAKGEGVGATTYNRPWSTKTKSVTGGALYYRANYLDKNQYTFYLKKFNVVNGYDKVGTHQYMTYIRAANSEGISMGKAYADNPNYPLTFCIPVFNNMPTSPVSQPGTTGNNDNVLNSLRVIRADTEGQYTLTPTSGNGGFYRYSTNYTANVPSSVTKVIVNGVAHNNVSYVSGTTETITLGGYDSSLPAGYKNIGSTKLTTSITVDPLKIYSGAGLSFSSIGSYKKGTIVTVTGTATDSLDSLWYKVSYAGSTGYISSGGTNKLTTTKYYSDWMTGTTKANLNVRKSPSTAQTELGTIASGTKITIYGYVINPDGKKWYMTSYKGATVSGGDVITLKTGTNVINLVVKSTSGLKRTYTITIKRT